MVLFRVWRLGEVKCYPTVGITVSFIVKVTVTVQVSDNDRIWGRLWSEVWCDVVCKLGNSADNLCLPRSVAYSAELVLLNMHKISGGGACLHCYQKLVSPAIQFLLWPTVQWFCFGTFACFTWMCKLTIVDCIVHAATLIVSLLLLALYAFSTFLHFCFIDFSWILVQAIYIDLVLYKNTISTITLHWPRWPSKCAVTFPCCNHHQNTVLCANRMQAMCMIVRMAKV